MFNERNEFAMEKAKTMKLEKELDCIITEIGMQKLEQNNMFFTNCSLDAKIKFFN